MTSPSRRMARSTAATILGAGLAVTGAGLATAPVSADEPPSTVDSAHTTVLNPAADAYIDSTAVDDNFGDQSELRVSRGTASTFLSFDPSEHTENSVELAKLRLYATDGADAVRQLQIHAVPGLNWSESEITWNNASHHYGQWLEMVDGFEGTGWYEADVTGYVNEHLADGEPLTFRIENERATPLTFNGRLAESRQPELVLIGGAAEEHAAGAEDAVDGSDLWLRYPELPGATLEHVRDHVRHISLAAPEHIRGGEVIRAAAEELQLGFSSLTGRNVALSNGAAGDGAVMIGTIDGSGRMRALLDRAGLLDQVRAAGDEGFAIASVTQGRNRMILVASTAERGALYGAFRLLELAQLGADLDDLNVTDAPAVQHRMNNHWANYAANVPGAMGGWNTVERGYSGHSLWQMDRPVEEVLDRYTAYARANASVGINGTVVNNVNASDHWIRTENLPRVAEIADALRPYGVQVYLALRFDSPITLGGLPTADPLDPDVRAWWQEKVEEIYAHIPDFGGFLVKGDSEGQPGPLQYDRTHAEGANMLAEGLEPYDGVLIWRAFVYGPGISDPDPDRLKQPYELFEPLDGEFADNVILQSKNGPFDFQPHEPVAPLLGAMPNTNTGIELPIMKEYTGHSHHVNYLMPEFERIFAFDTHANGQGTPVSDVVDGSAFEYTHTLVAGVANHGTDANWTRHPLDQANWYGFGRQAWDPTSSSEQIASDWADLTFGTEPDATATIVDLLMASGPTYAMYAQPLGLPIVTESASHFKNDVSSRTSFNRETESAVGYDRTSATGSDYVGQYHGPVAEQFEQVETTPEEVVLFFHHLDYTSVLPHSDTSVIQRIYDLTFEGVDRAEQQVQTWRSLQGTLEDRQWHEVLRLLKRQTAEATNFRNLTNSHFHETSGVDDERGRTDAFSVPTSTVPDQIVRPGEAVQDATSTEPGRIYLVPEEWGGLGKWEQPDRFDLAADRMTGTTAAIDSAGVAGDLDAPLVTGSYRLYAADEHGNVSEASSETVTVLAEEVHFDVTLTDDTLVGGQASSAQVRVVNGFAEPIEFDVALESPDDWDVEPLTGNAEPREATDMTMTVTPPASVPPTEQIHLRFTLTAGDLQDGADFERSVVPNGEQISLALDAGTTSSPVFETYTALTPEDQWDRERGFGWVESTPQSRDRGGPDPLRQDLIADEDQPATLRIAVPPGAHDAHVMVGDAGADFGDTIISADGVDVANIGSELGGTGNWGWAQFEVDGGTDGRTVDLEFVAASGFWRINSVVVIPASPAPQETNPDE